ncbi:TPA: DUF551 domain-containing protein [Acinetobacter baumannii]|uniref:DUF551 domain-containing protein n=1 Tax=Acinetobacter baumannii TaxID=470 RepID=UPI000D3BA1CE|nr:DUF551 domain-containing protein [Acinetobacter baumannii]PUV05854.1 hypothetical protein DCD77_06165 [Acinetobacter baumannii]HAV2935005.1 DUF551 domain-containing protein [Acinetobacter baumannii]HAV3089996.1 DUF551 domain-containing protein [Acinetobacter baumannii]HAV4623353.1 DUF551 domain-containing protein [Acinetobacter baumannii]HAV4638254.1 DUF551 domain-containing protein [Acinetobacter baumannii]
MTDLNKERMELELSAGVLDRQIDNLKAEIAEEYYDDEKLELLIEYAMKLGEVYAQRDLLEKAKAQAVPTWISVKDEEPPTDTMVLICWSDSSDVQPEIDYMTCDEDLNHIWANFEIDPPTHWMYFHKVPSESGAEQ